MAQFDPETSAEMLAQLDAYHAQIGRVTSSWAVLDLVIDGILWRIAEIQPLLGACLTSQIPSIHTKLRALVALLSLLEGGTSFVRRVNTFNNDIRGLLEKRNRVIHDAWAVSDNAEDVSQVTKAITGKEITVGFTSTDFEEITRTNSQIWERIKEARALSSDIEDWISSSPRKWLRPLDGVTIRD